MPPDPLPSSIPTEGPCHPWVTVEEVRTSCGVQVDEVSDADLNFGIQLASLVLWANTGRRYGLCLRTVRPCFPIGHQYGFRSELARGADWFQRFSDLDDLLSTEYGASTALAGWPSTWTCSCSLPVLQLPGPIAAIQSVVVDGVVLPQNAFRIKTGGHMARRVVIRADGESWPCQNDLMADPTVVPATAGGVPAWQVTFWQGRAIQQLQKDITGILALELARFKCRSPRCDEAMNQQLSRVARRGVTKDYDVKMTKDEKTGQVRTGIRPVDDWVNAVNPSGLRRPPKMVRADDSERRRIWEWVEVA